VSDTGELRQGVNRDAVVRPLALAADRACSRPSCSAPASATLMFNYGEREAWIAGLAESRSPQSYDLCASHAARTQAPHGWRLRDQRPPGQQTAAPSPSSAAFDGADTVAVLAAALRAVPDLPTPEPVADAPASAQSGIPAPEPAAPGPVAQPFRSAPDRGDEPADATLEGSTASPALEASAAVSEDAPPLPRPVLAERIRPAGSDRGVAADW
jgi:hypothetical protein